MWAAAAVPVDDRRLPDAFLRDADTSATHEPRLGGLSEFGREVVAEMNLCDKVPTPARSAIDRPGLGSVPL